MQLRTAGAGVYPIPDLPRRILLARSCGAFLGLAHHGLLVFPSSARTGDHGFSPTPIVPCRLETVPVDVGEPSNTGKLSSSSDQPHCSRIGLTWPMSLPNRCHAGTLYPTAIRGIREDACRTTRRSHAAQFLIHYRRWGFEPTRGLLAPEDFKSSASAIPPRRPLAIERNTQGDRSTRMRRRSHGRSCRSCQSVLRSI